MVPTGSWNIQETQLKLLEASEVPLEHPVRVFHDYYLAKRDRD